jgi:hypothetical protein
MRRRLVRSLLAGGVLVALALPTSAVVTPAVATTSVPAFSRVFVIVGENTEITQVNGNSMPFFTKTFRPDAAWLTNYWATTHFSTANYIAMTSGQYTPCEQFDYKPARCHQDVPNLFSQLTSAHISWHAWNESMAGSCALVNNGSSKTLNSYAVKHNPAVYYDDVVIPTGGSWGGAVSQLCSDNVVPMGSADAPNDTSTFDRALASGDVPRFNFIVPNMCEDGHDNCPIDVPGPLRQFDAFLEREVPKILASPAFDENSVLIVTFDEGASTSGGGGSNGGTPCTAWESCPNAFHGGGHIAFAVQGDNVIAGNSSRYADHYSFLRTIEDGFGLNIHVGAAAHATAISGIWGS